MTISKVKFLIKTRSTLSSFFLFLLLSFFLSSCDTPSASIVSVHGRTMGTTYSVKLVGAKSELPSSETLTSWADETFLSINQSMSTYIPDSELSLLNTSGNEQWQPVSDDLFYVLSLSQKVSHLSAGAFDVTVAPLVDLWGFGPKAQLETIPSQAQIENIKSGIGFRLLQLNAEEKTIRKPRGLSVDLSAVAKGFAADHLAHRLMGKGYKNLMVEVGGELVLQGVNQKGRPWTIGIETPNYGLLSSESSPVRAVKLSSHGMATSGDYRNYYEQEGVRYSHTIDPNTGKPISHALASVTVIAGECAEADALATALNVMGPQKAMALAEENGLAVYLIVRDQNGFNVQYSKAFKPYLVEE